MKIHQLADVQSNDIGEGTTVWQYAVILKGAVIGKNCNINCHTFIEDDVIIGNNVTVKSGVYLWNGLRIDDDVFIGPSVVFTNDLRPRSKHYTNATFTSVKKGASLGANSMVLAGITIGKYAMTGIGSVVTKNVPDHALVYGNPARVMGWVDEQGEKLLATEDNKWISVSGTIYHKNSLGNLEIV